MILCTRLGIEAGSVPATAAMVRAVWVARYGNHATPEAVKRMAEVLTEEDREYLEAATKDGVKAQFDGTREQQECEPHNSFLKNFPEGVQKFWKDAKEGRSLFFNEQAPLEGVISSPMGMVPKIIPDRTISEEHRPIRDLRKPNENSPKERHPTVECPTHREIARRIMELKMRFPGVPVMMSKRDIEGAFKRVWMSLDDIGLFATDFPAEPLWGHDPEGGGGEPTVARRDREGV